MESVIPKGPRQAREGDRTRSKEREYPLMKAQTRCKKIKFKKQKAGEKGKPEISVK